MVVVLDAIVVLVLFVAWLREGRDPRTPLIDDSVLLPAPPPELTPVLAAVLRQDGVDGDVMATAVVDLAARGLLSMRPSDGAVGRRHAVDYVMADAADPAVAAAEAKLDEPGRFLLGQLRTAARDGVVTPVDLARARNVDGKLGKVVGKVAAATPWFRKNPGAAGDSLSGLLFVPLFSWLPVALAFGALTDLMDGKAFLVMLVAGVVTLIVGGKLTSSMAARTPAGAQVLAMALAYRNTLEHALAGAAGILPVHDQVKVKLPWLETPDALVVWAVALGLAHQVGAVIGRGADAPSGIAWQPAWYAGPAASFAAFGSSISSIGVATSAAARGSYGGGYSGGGSFGGGGAGGGF